MKIQCPNAKFEFFDIRRGETKKTAHLLIRKEKAHIVVTCEQSESWGNPYWRKCMGIEPTREGSSPAHRI
jgi:hypothetical protein